MYKKEILIRFGDLMLKGKNQSYFVKRIKRLIKDKLSGLDIIIKDTYNRVYLELGEVDLEQVVERLKLVSGLHSFSFVYKTSLEFDDIKNTAKQLLIDELNESDDFKIETKRANKKLPFTSQEFTKKLAPALLKEFQGQIKVNVKNPKEILRVELREEASYLYLKTIKGMGGFPVGTGGEALAMLSGGIDSPVAAYLAIKQGITINLLHFESSPLTPLESVDKVIKLAEILAKYMPKNKIQLLVVHFTKIHEQILTHIPESYHITIMRRMMYRIAEGLAIKHKYLAIFNGESIGQVASQTLESLSVVEAVTTQPIIRPLATYDKNDIIKISQEIGTYETSIIPFEDCCTVYVPKRPVIKPKIDLCQRYEENFDYKKFVLEAIEKTESLILTHNNNFKISLYGLEFDDAYQEWKKEHDNIEK